MAETPGTLESHSNHETQTNEKNSNPCNPGKPRKLKPINGVVLVFPNSIDWATHRSKLNAHPGVRACSAGTASASVAFASADFAGSWTGCSEVESGIVPFVASFAASAAAFVAAVAVH